MDLRSYLKENIVYLDGGMGTLLQAKGLKAGELPERWNVTHSEVIKETHKAYYDAGSNVVSTNTFGANILKFNESELEEIIKCAVENARRAQQESQTLQPKWVALDVGPTGKMLAPYGELEFESAVEIFKTTVKLGVKYGVDLVIIETMNDSYETKAALLAVKETTDIPVFVSNAYSENGALMTGADPKSMVALLEGMGADAIGVNCSFGPKMLAPICREYLKYASVPILLKPNAGLPKVENGATMYDISEEEFALECKALIGEGVRVVGGCCGTTPRYVEALTNATKDLVPLEILPKHHTIISSYAKGVEIGAGSVTLIGERINPTGKKVFREALKNGDIDYVLKEGVSQEERGVHVLDVNVGIPDIDEAEVLARVVKELQAVIPLPLQIDTSNPVAMEGALRLYNGKALVNSVNGKEESMSAVFPLVKKYGGVVVALTLDENGIPEKAEGRVAIAHRIIERAKDYGIDKKDIIVDPLALTISADAMAGEETLKAVEYLTSNDIKTILGVSNVSFGLPMRDFINSTFFTLAMSKGLSAGIINPISQEMMKAYHTFNVLKGKDNNFEKYIAFAQNPSIRTESISAGARINNGDGECDSTLKHAIIKGLKEMALEEVDKLLNDHTAMDIINKEIIPALDVVGAGYEKGEVYLPGLLLSADISKAVFERIKKTVPKSGEAKGVFVIATVQGDIHDIGKNIVKLLLENYGFKVVDLGKDVAPEKVVEAVKEHNAPLCGLSALMTTTVPAMEKTIKLLRESAPWCKICVGGAVMTKEYALKIGADKYCKDGMETVRYAEEVAKNK